jgi:hypothetical protein
MKKSREVISTNDWAQCHTPVIPARQGLDIGRTVVPRQPRQRSSKDSISKEAAKC